MHACFQHSPAETGDESRLPCLCLATSELHAHWQSSVADLSSTRMHYVAAANQQPVIRLRMYGRSGAETRPIGDIGDFLAARGQTGESLAVLEHNVRPARVNTISRLPLRDSAS